MFRPEQGEISIKVTGYSADEIEELYRFLEERYRVLSRSRLVENDRDNGYHMFYTITPKAEAS